MQTQPYAYPYSNLCTDGLTVAFAFDSTIAATFGFPDVFTIATANASPGAATFSHSDVSTITTANAVAFTCAYSSAVAPSDPGALSRTELHACT